MEWEQKAEMVKLGNQIYRGEEEKKKFQKYALDNVDKFDEQSWDMFSNIVELVPEEMEKDKEFWESIYEHIKNIDCNDKKFGFRSGLRISLIQTICEEKLKFNN